MSARRLHLDISEGYKNRLTLTVYWGIRILMLVAAAGFAIVGQLDSAGATLLILAAMVVPSILRGRYRLYLPFTLDLGIALFVFLTLFVGGMASFYQRIPVWDKFLHLQSGFLLGAIGYIVIYTLNEHKKVDLGLSPGFITLFAITFSLTLGATWEIAEFTGDWLFGGHWQGYSLSNADTMWDLIADCAGALIVSIPGYFWMRRHKRLPLTPWFLRSRRG